MKYPDWLETFPMRRTMRGSTPGSSTYFQMEVRVQASSNGFLVGSDSNSSIDSSIEPMPVTNEQQALEIFSDLWRRAQAKAAAHMDQAAKDDAAQ